MCIFYATKDELGTYFCSNFLKHSVPVLILVLSLDLSTGCADKFIIGFVIIFNASSEEIFCESNQPLKKNKLSY